MVGWFKCSERTPQQQGEYIVNVYLDNGSETGQFFQHWDGEKWQKFDSSVVTHWMPIPEPPKD